MLSLILKITEFMGKIGLGHNTQTLSHYIFFEKTQKPIKMLAKFYKCYGKKIHKYYHKYGTSP